MNPNLIPHTVNIVIGEGLYELKLWVEMNAEVGNPHLLEMDDNHGGDSSGHRKDKDFNLNEKQANFGPKTSSGGSSNNSKSMNARLGKKVSKLLQCFSYKCHLVWSRK
jgi:hypothetical protein